MRNLYAIKDHFKESQLYLSRTTAATVVVLLLIFILIGRLIFLQVYQHDLYKTLSLNNQVRIVPITPLRGLIFDRNGILLAENIPAFSLDITPERTPNLEETLVALNEIIPLTDSEKQAFYKQLKYKRKNESIPLRLKLTEAEVAKFSIEKYRFPGVEVNAHLIRHYPQGEATAHALGYIGPISEKELEILNVANYRGTYYIGKTGIEKYHEALLHGQSGYQHIEADAKGRMLRVLKRIAPVPGANLHLSLDSKLQQICFDALQDMRGAIIALDPNTGGILALVSRPSFDPNLFAQGIDAGTYRALQQDESRPLFNRAIRGQYPPGSTIKPLVALQGLETGVINPQFRLFDPGWYQLNGQGRLYRDWIYAAKHHGHGWVDLEKAIQESCDTYFFTLAHRLGIKHLQDIYTRFGLGKITQIDMSGEIGGLVPSSDWKKRAYNEAWYPGDTLNVGIGQGSLLATPLQMAQVAAIIANRGQHIKPKLVSATSHNHEAPLLETPIEKGAWVQLKNPEHWDTVIQAMQKVVHAPGGTAFRISQGLRYQIAGKTGTSQVFNLKQNEKYAMFKGKAHLRDHSWFIAFAPIDKPEIAIAVLIENAHLKTGKEIARIVLDGYFNTTPPPRKAEKIETEIEIGAE